ncbi:hypothetical protein LRAMOSA08054 [Lichtheimia ramosa]|uniref:Distal membrane-arm assembly complex protein 1-like domain-containing protein n=1 Tax=Lichtheimia ramosa TaxID=688394 RepID=A0A077WCW2_9FUNG|nr:hypothetical protein LRAMOSA08054 [Lichtheimia ramosa]
MKTQDQQEIKKEYQDCMSCKIIGATAFGGLGAYALREATKLQKKPGRQNAAVGVGVAGVVFLSAGIYRLLM